METQKLNRGVCLTLVLTVHVHVLGSNTFFVLLRYYWPEWWHT